MSSIRYVEKAPTNCTLAEKCHSDFDNYTSHQADRYFDTEKLNEEKSINFKQEGQSVEGHIAASIEVFQNIIN